MAITPADIEQLTFSPSKHGYDTDEVDSFLEQLSGEVDAMLQKIAELKGRLNTSEQQLAASQAQVQQLQDQVQNPSFQAPVASQPAPDYSASEHQISQALIVAQQSADKIVADAKENAEKIRNEADQKAREVIRQALAEKQNELDEIDRLKQSREEFRAEYKDLIQHFMDDADAAFPNQVLTTPTGSNGTRHSAQRAVAMPAAPVTAEETVYAPPVNQSQAGSPTDMIDDLD